jgi:hypothetical protein
MTEPEFELILTKAVIQLNNDVAQTAQYHSPDVFEKRVHEILIEVAKGENVRISPTFHAHAFPDIRANGFGVEVKTTSKDNWQSVGNSVFEGMRDEAVKKIYVVFGKMGGLPAVRWGHYEKCINHVRISHAPRFCLEMENPESLFDKLQISYDDFCRLPAQDKMRYIRKYSRDRRKPGEQLWWIEYENSMGIPLEIRLYTSLPKDEKIKIRAECAILFPEICKGKRARGKYKDVSFFMLKYHNVIANQIRDLFSAGSVAGAERGGHYLSRALKAIESQMREAASRLDGDLFEEYWLANVPPEQRITEWLKRADSFATEWRPSDILFKSG